MAVCPLCQNQLVEDFGNEVCSKCGATVFVESEEIVHVQNASAMEAAVYEINSKSTGSEITRQSKDSLDPFSPLDSSIYPTEVSSDNSISSTVLEADLESKSESVNHTDPFFNTSEFNDYPLDSEAPSVNGVVDQDHQMMIENEIETDTATTELTPTRDVKLDSGPTSASDFFSEMQLLGDMDSDKFKESSYFFDIEIAEIDSKDLRDEILDHLTDSRLGLKENDLDKQIKNGVLLLKDISAVKTHVIVQKLSHLPCQLSWVIKEVHELAQIESQDEDNISEDRNSIKSDVTSENEFEDFETP